MNRMSEVDKLKRAEHRGYIVGFIILVFIGVALFIMLYNIYVPPISAGSFEIRALKVLEIYDYDGNYAADCKLEVTIACVESMPNGFQIVGFTTVHSESERLTGFTLEQGDTVAFTFNATGFEGQEFDFFLKVQYPSSSVTTLVYVPWKD